MENSNVVTFPSMAVMRQRLNAQKNMAPSTDDIHVALILDSCCQAASSLNQRYREGRLTKAEALGDMEAYVDTYNYILQPSEDTGFAVMILNNPESLLPGDMSEERHSYALRLLNAQYKFTGIHMRNCLLLSES